MESPRKYFLFCMVAAGAVMNMRVCSAVRHVVGDDRGWDSAYQDFQGWASRRIFRVGDNLWFAYASSEQSVIELRSQEYFEKCELRNPLRIYDGGLDAVALVKVGSRYFSSGRAEDCRNGMKLWINVISDGMENHGSDNFDVVSDGMESHGAGHHYSNSVSNGMEKRALNMFKLVSNGMENMDAAEGPAVSVTSGGARFAYSLLFLCFGCLTTTLYVMI